jgi:hypothetical protein
MPRIVQRIAPATIAIVAFVGFFAIPRGPRVTIDNRGYLGPYDVMSTPYASGRLWLRLGVLGLGLAVAMLVSGLGSPKRPSRFAASGLVVLGTGILLAVAYPTGPRTRRQRKCLPGGPLGPEAPPCRVYYSDHQPGPTYGLLRLAFLVAGTSGGVVLLRAGPRPSQGAALSEGVRPTR